VLNQLAYENKPVILQPQMHYHSLICYYYSAFNALTNAFIALTLLAE